MQAVFSVFMTLSAISRCHFHARKQGLTYQKCMHNSPLKITFSCYPVLYMPGRTYRFSLLPLSSPLSLDPEDGVLALVPLRSHMILLF